MNGHSAKITATVALAIAWCAVALARISEPANIYYGEVRGPLGEPLTDAVVIARVSGVECARDYVGKPLASNVNYLLRVPLDDGWDTRFAAYAARVGDRLDLAIVLDGAEFAAEQQVPLVGPRATLQHADMQAAPEPGMLGAGLLAALGLAARRERKR